MKRILIMGTCSSVFVKEYIVYMKKYNSDLSFELLGDDFGIFELFYRRHKIKMHKLPDEKKNPLKRKIAIDILKNRFDYIHIHVVRNETIELAKQIAANKSKIIISYWDHPTSSSEIKRTGCYLNDLYKISVVSDNLRNEFVYNYGNQYNDKLVQVDLVMSCLEKIIRISKRNDIDKCVKNAKMRLNLPKDKFIIAVGYCGRRDQQHIKIIEEVLKLAEDYRRKVCLFLHVSYGVEMKSYIKKLENLKKLCERNGITVIISDEFLEGRKLVDLRYAVDVFINAQLRDALSGTMLEYLATGTNVINGEWLDYSDLNKKNIVYKNFSKFDELPEIIVDSIQKGINYDNIKIIGENWSWEKRAPIWNNLYN